MFSDAAKLKKSIALKGKPSFRSYYDKEAQAAKSRQKWLEKYNATSFDELGPENKRRRVFEEQKFCCIKCGISEWFSKPISLELEHKDGNHHNNKRENLEMLCPNCHSLTETWRGRNKTEKRHKIPDNKLLEILLSNDWNMRKSLIEVGLSPKGGNYNRCHRLKKEYFNIIE